MKEKTKEFFKKNLIGFILGFVSVGIVVVYAETYFPSNDVTYDNTESGLSSTDVQGANPNNYIMFSNDLWRIISVEGDGTIKIIRNNDIGNMSWDKTGGQYGSNVWTRPADLNTYLNSDYLNTLSEKEKIDNHNWNIGMVDANSRRHCLH